MIVRHLIHEDRPIFWTACTFQENPILKGQRWLWHGGDRCAPSCQACRAGVGRAWWTWSVERAASLAHWADDRTRPLLLPRLLDRPLQAPGGPRGQSPETPGIPDPTPNPYMNWPDAQNRGHRSPNFSQREALRFCCKILYRKNLVSRQLRRFAHYCCRAGPGAGSHEAAIALVAQWAGELEPQLFLLATTGRKPDHPLHPLLPPRKKKTKTRLKLSS